MVKKIHFIASIVSFLIIITFFVSTITVELAGNFTAIAKVKSLIVFPGLVILLPAMAATGITGFKISKNKKDFLVRKKKNRMPIMAGIGLLILVPTALTLNIWASTHEFGIRFYTVQLIELLGGAVNIMLMSKSMKDGLQLSGRLRLKSKRTSLQKESEEFM